MPSYTSSTLHVDRPLSNFATAYENHKLIGTLLCPEISVEKSSDKFFKRNKRDAFQYQNPKISGLQVPPEIEQGATLVSFACEDYGYTARVAERDNQNADLPLNLRQDATMAATEQLRLAQEVRIKDLLTTSGNYASANVQTLSGSDCWDSASGGDPFAVIDAAKAGIFRGQNTKLVAFCGEETWRVLRRHPQILDTIKGGATTGMPAVAMKQNFAQMIEVDEFVVGEAWHTTTNPGATASYSRIWPVSFGIVAVATHPTPRCLHFASSFAYGPLEVSAEFQMLPGLKGAWVFKVAHSTDEVVVADDAGALIVTPINN
jgi:hypothetical protein